MVTPMISTPKFVPDQEVMFAGGKGTIKTLRPGANTWIYAVEMEMGPEPDMGRIGPETTVLLMETELCVN